MDLSISLRPRDQAGLSELLAGLYDPEDPRYHQFLTPEEFRSRFAPSDADVTAVTRYLSARGLKVRSVSANNMIVNVDGSGAEVENAFQVELHDYATERGDVAFAPEGDPLVMGEAAERVLAVNGLSSSSRRRPSGRLKARLGPDPRAYVSDYMTPAKIRNAYGLNALTQTGAGETLALFELDVYHSADIDAFANYFGLTVPTLQNVTVDGGPRSQDKSDGGRGEVTLDIEVAMATAPGLSKIMVYEGPNTDQGVLNTYSRIASDNSAKVVSTSWGLSEIYTTSSFRNSENAIFQQMAAQGQSIFAASGDYGAYDDYDNNPTSRLVDDPASQPYVTAVGGTTLNSDATTGAYVSESSWGDSARHLGGGGGISSLWAKPSWQAGVATITNKGCALDGNGNPSCPNGRLVPDVSLDANPSTGYPVYLDGAWYAFGGTSAAAPVWAAFMAIVNQGRVQNGLGRIGFANPTIYKIGASSLAASAFHDIADNTNNLYYPAVAGYDLSTGWGTIKGSGLFQALTAGVDPPTAPTSLTLISGPANVTASWAGATGATSYKVYRSATGTGYTALATGITATSYTDSAATGLAYYYVTAVNAAGESSPSPVQQGGPGLAPPGAPASLTGTVVP
jgi:kumamolisin